MWGKASPALPKPLFEQLQPLPRQMNAYRMRAYQFSAFSSSCHQKYEDASCVPSRLSSPLRKVLDPTPQKTCYHPQELSLNPLLVSQFQMHRNRHPAFSDPRGTMASLRIQPHPLAYGGRQEHATGPSRVPRS